MYNFSVCCKSLLLWLVVNLFLPMLLPTIILYALSTSMNNGMGFFQIFIELLNRGMYVFSSFSLTFSLFESHAIARRVIQPWQYMIICISLVFIIFMFIACNPIFIISEMAQFREISSKFIMVFVFHILFTTWLKWKILTYCQY